MVSNAALGVKVKIALRKTIVKTLDDIYTFIMI
jgi:hypothetical protein